MTDLFKETTNLSMKKAESGIACLKINHLGADCRVECKRVGDMMVVMGVHYDDGRECSAETAQDIHVHRQATLSALYDIEMRRRRVAVNN